MGCNCKDDNKKSLNVDVKDKSLSSVLKKAVSGILLFLLIVVLTPVIVIMIWYFTIKIFIGSDDNVIGGFIDMFKKTKKVEEVEEEINIDEYELMDVDIIK